MVSNRPDMYVGVAFNADPFDANAVPVWSDLTARVLSISSAARGRQYELDRNQAGNLSIDWHNADEALNPVNAGSPFFPNVLPYRQILARCMWPNDDTGNLLNLASTNTDPSFEIYGTGGGGAFWLTRLGGVVPTITTTTPQQGTKSVTYTVAGTTTTQGLSWVVPCIPGRQYTTSVYARQSSASTQQLAVGGFYAYHTFAVPSVNGWSPLDSGQVVTTGGGTAADFSVSGGVGRQSHNTVGTLRSCTADLGAADFDITVDVTLNMNSAATAPVTQWVCGRLADPSNYYNAQLTLNTSGTVLLGLFKRVAGTLTPIGSNVTVGTAHRSGDTWRVHFTGTGNALAASAWIPDSGSEPTTPSTSQVDTSLTTGTGFGLMSRLETGNTNTLPVTVAWSTLNIRYSSAGTSTTTTGAYVRLTETFTAQQPTHTVQLATSGTAVAGTVNLDAMQHEPGAVANPFTASGPLIRNIWTRGYVERWPVGWVDGGFRGVSVTPCVGPLAILANADLHTEYRSSVLAKSPKYYWTLQEPQGAATFGEASGNGGPALLPLTSKYGGTTPPAAGTQASIVGDPSGVGVLFTEDTSTPAFPNTSYLATRGTVLAVGQQGTVGISPLPAAPGASWATSVSIWVNITAPAPLYDYQVICATFDNTITVSTGNSYNNNPFQMTVRPNGILELKCQVTVTGTSGAYFATSAASICDGKWHHAVGVVSQDNTNTVLTLYVDGVNVGSSTTATSVNGMLSSSATNFQIGGRFSTSTNYVFTLGGTVAHAAIWYRALSVSEVADLWNAGKGYPGELESTRIARYLAGGGYTGPTNIQTGASVMGPGTVKEGDALLDASQRVADSAFGNFFEDVNGIAYASRNVRYLRTTASYVFGERVDLGEYPYEGDLIYDFDPAQILNIADVTRTGGIKAHAEDATNVSQKRYGKKNFTRDVDIASDNEAIDAATWVVANRKDPRLRVAAMTFDPSAVRVPFGDGTLWPMVVSLEIGTRVTVKRRPKAANAGAGITMSADFFVEAINQHDINFETGAWKTTLLLSPVNQAQPWILGDATYGLLGQTTVLGF